MSLLLRGRSFRANRCDTGSPRIFSLIAVPPGFALRAAARLARQKHQVCSSRRLWTGSGIAFELAIVPPSRDHCGNCSHHPTQRSRHRTAVTRTSESTSQRRPSGPPTLAGIKDPSATSNPGVAAPHSHYNTIEPSRRRCPLLVHQPAIPDSTLASLSLSLDSVQTKLPLSFFSAINSHSASKMALPPVAVYLEVISSGRDNDDRCGAACSRSSSSLSSTLSFVFSFLAFFWCELPFELPLFSLVCCLYLLSSPPPPTHVPSSTFCCKFLFVDHNGQGLLVTF